MYVALCIHIINERLLSTVVYRYEPYWRSQFRLRYKANGKIYYFTNEAGNIDTQMAHTPNEPIIHAHGDRIDQRAVM